MQLDSDYVAMMVTHCSYDLTIQVQQHMQCAQFSLRFGSMWSSTSAGIEG